LEYTGEYTDPGTNVTGYLYHLKGANFERYFLVAKEGAQGPGDSQRYVVDYYGDGSVKSYFVETVSKPVLPGESWAAEMVGERSRSWHAEPHGC
jgi:hypothetical protein